MWEECESVEESVVDPHSGDIQRAESRSGPSGTRNVQELLIAEAKQNVGGGKKLHKLPKNESAFIFIF